MIKESKKLVSKRQQTFSLKTCIEKYGPEEGLVKFNERQVKWQKTLYKNGKLKSGYSEVSQELFFKLIEDVEINESNYFIFAKKGGEFVLNDDNGFYRYDFTDLKNKKIIEYNGDDYHGNPNKYKADDFPNPFRKDLTAKDIWDKDKSRIEQIQSFGYTVIIIWESEFNKSIDKTKKRILNEIKKCENKINKKNKRKSG
jgi:very-short-patch-repair endonuclease